MTIEKQELAIVVANTIQAVSTFVDKLQDGGVKDINITLPDVLIITEDKDGKLKDITVVLKTADGHDFGPLKLAGLDTDEELT